MVTTWGAGAEVGALQNSQDTGQPLDTGSSAPKASDAEAEARTQGPFLLDGGPDALEARRSFQRSERLPLILSPLPGSHLELGSWQARKLFTCRGRWKTHPRSPPGSKHPQRPLNLLWSPA